MSVSLDRWEKMIRADKLVPVTKEQRGGAVIYVAAGDDVRTDKPDEYPHGYYKAMWAIGDANQLQIAQPMEFDTLHDVENLPIAARAAARINAAVHEADLFIKNCKNDGDGLYAR